MKPIHIAAIAAAVAILTTFMVVPMVAAQKAPELPKPEIVKTLTVDGLTVAQIEWIRKLELCESSGNPRAVNPLDRDGTPSYGAFQFKPSTLDYYAKVYGIIFQDTDIADENVMSRPIQLAVVQAMVRDSKNINWLQQFPDCVKRHIGFPPKSAQ